MFNLNNKGQSLVMFIVLLPIILIMFTIAYDVGNAIYEKNSMSNTNYMVIEYGLSDIDDIDENDLIDLIRKNNSDLNNISVLVEDNTIYIKTVKNINGVIGKSFNLTTVVSEYKGELNGDEKIIERIK